MLTHARYNGDADRGATYAEPLLSWSGALAVGESISVTYSVTAESAGELVNVVVTPHGAGANCAAGSDDPDCSTRTLILPPGLPLTGGELTLGALIVGLGLLALGAWLLARRRAHVAA